MRHHNYEFLFKMNIQRLKSVLLLFPAFIRRFIYRYHPGYRAKEKLAASIRQKDVITVAFLVMELACWKCDSLFRLMQQHSRFFPLIWIMRDEQIKNENEWARNLKEMQNFFALRGYQVAELLTLEEMRAQYAPDIVFLQKPFARVAGSRVRMMNRELTCYVPYCFQNGKKHDFIQGQENMIWRYFYTTPGILRICKQVMLNAAANVVITGSPTADNFLKEEFATGGITWKKSQPGMKKIIWAPHWSISPGISWFQVSTFLAVADGMLQLAERYGDKVQWAFKPHPLLRDTLYQHPEWGIERTD
ncbi:MAG: hypothetical protein Q4A54_12620, partial [Parabacteroides sp.]|nr:hypothetical protein [Parabacteroides sp.]